MINQNYWDKLREIYINWVSKTHLRSYFSKEMLVDGFSIWWITSTCNRNNVLNNSWYFNLKKIYFKEKKNYRSIYFKINFFLFFFLNLFKNFLKDILQTIIIKILFSNKKNENKKIDNCFYSIHFNFLDKKSNNKYYDRCYGHTPTFNVIKNKNIYLINISKFNEFFFNFLSYKKKFDHCGLKYFISNSYVSIFTIIRIYLIVFFRFIKLSFYLRKKNPFIINNIDCSSVLKYHLLKSFSGEIQSYLINSNSISNFIKKNKTSRFITYGEFNPGFRAIYYNIKAIKKERPSIIAVQHGYSNKNIFFHNYRKIEFKKNSNQEGKFYSPAPDYYFIQGNHYYKLLSKYFPNKIKIIGSLKYDNFKFKFHNSKKKLNKKIKNILVCPSIGDEIYLLNFIKKIKKKGLKFTISPHPTVYNQTIELFKKELGKLINIDKEKSTYDLFKKSDLILAGFSVTAIEAIAQGKAAVRLISENNPTFFDPNDGLLTINSAQNPDFSKNSYYNYYNKKKVNKIKKNLFFKLDNCSYKRFWKQILEINSIN